MVAEFEDDSIPRSSKHHEQTKAVQTTFAKEVKALGNPSKEDKGDLLTMDTKLIIDSEVHTFVENAYCVGQEQYELFVKERFVEQTKSIKDPIKKKKITGVNHKSTEAKVPGCNNEGRLFLLFQIIHCMPIQVRKS